MSDLDTLMKLSGAVAAFRFSDKGELLEHQVSDDTISTDVLDLLAHVCIANTSIATMQARGWEKLTGMSGFYPINGFTLIGFDWSAVTANGMGVVVKNGDADYEAAYAALSQ